MTDDLLDEATRLADHLGTADGELVRALVERVREAENNTETLEGIVEIRTAERDEYKTGEGLANGVAERWARRCMEARAERDAARGKLDKVRALVTNPPVFGDLAPVRWYGFADMQRDVLAILDGKTGD
ncbi:hypothetical protein JN535_08535 [Cellulosimicrobium cellulans]|uniref:hypothetical protein n=1 Tax=Cellulosimicrobium cellulans TaxID=1710 RepID=UPI0019631AC7|nr:hypothetical protein [Cellulosimicrobium cellulans]MBN0040212.1 hypothetical protein [Cellulosimicrobium cellulans]